MSVGVWQIVLIILVVLILFGKGKISSFMGDLAKGIKAFKDGMDEESANAPAKASEKKPALKNVEKAPVKKAVAKKEPVKKAPAKKAPAAKAPAKKVAVAKAPAKKAAPKKVAAKKAAPSKTSSKKK